ncbi:MAG TPA: protein kinase, partial [Labilithrix sp.]|nr:protein kinase [Labilithrix sp.]
MTKGESTVERVGAYRVVRKLANGATSDVLLAKTDGPLGSERTVVLKLFAQLREDEELVRSFGREASAYSRLSHPTIVRLFDFFALPASAAEGLTPSRAGHLCMVLEHVDGPPLVRLRSMLKLAGQELDDRASIHVATCIFDALAVAHAAIDVSGTPAPVIHRDVNPSNVLLSWDGQVKLADFGVAKVTGLSHESPAGVVKGTYGYMAPEQVRGDALTPRSDVYSAGIILWELLAKRRAFQRGALPEVEALRAMAEPRLPSLDSIRPDVDPVIREALKRALEPRAERRTITAEEMVALLGANVPAEEGRRHLVGALSVVRANAEAPGAGGLPARTSARPEAQTTKSTAPSPATLPGVAPPPGDSDSDLVVPKLGAPRPPSGPELDGVPDALDVVRRPAPTPRRSLVDSG